MTIVPRDALSAMYLRRHPDAAARRRATRRVIMPIIATVAACSVRGHKDPRGDVAVASIAVQFDIWQTTGEDKACQPNPMAACGHHKFEF